MTLRVTGLALRGCGRGRAFVDDITLAPHRHQSSTSRLASPHSLRACFPLSLVANMLSTTRSAASMALRGRWPTAATHLSPAIPCSQLRIAKPSAALMPFRTGSVAYLSSSSSNKATAGNQQTPGLVAGGPGTPPPMKAMRTDVPLPSQEGKKGAMQYALYVLPYLVRGK